MTVLRYWLRPFTGHHAMIGPDAWGEGSDYWWSVPISDKGELTGFSTIPATVETLMQAFIAAGELGFVPTPASADGFKEALRAANALGFSNPKVERRGGTPRSLSFSNGVAGAFKMDHQKHKHAHHDDKKPDGTLDQAGVKANVAAYNDAVQSGKVTILAVGDPLPIPGLSGVVSKTVIMRE